MSCESVNMSVCSSSVQKSTSSTDSDSAASCGFGSRPRPASDLLLCYIDNFERQSSAQSQGCHSASESEFTPRDGPKRSDPSFQVHYHDGSCESSDGFASPMETGRHQYGSDQLSDSYLYSRPRVGYDNKGSRRQAAQSKPAVNVAGRLWHRSHHQFAQSPAASSTASCGPLPVAVSSASAGSATTLCWGDAVPLSLSRRQPSTDLDDTTSLAEYLRLETTCEDLDLDDDPDDYEGSLHMMGQRAERVVTMETVADAAAGLRLHAAAPWDCSAETWRLQERILRLASAGDNRGRILSSAEKASIRDRLARLQFGGADERAENRTGIRPHQRRDLGRLDSQGGISSQREALSTDRLSRLMRSALDLVSSD